MFYPRQNTAVTRSTGYRKSLGETLRARHIISCPAEGLYHFTRPVGFGMTHTPIVPDAGSKKRIDEPQDRLMPRILYGSRTRFIPLGWK
jgi:hypothetical protein